MSWPGRTQVAGSIAVFFLLLGAGSAAAGSCEAGTVQGGQKPVAAEEGTTSFPVTAGAGKRYLEDAAGRPFFMHGDSAWSLIAQLTREDAEIYLRDRKARGFNTILVNLLEHRFASRAPANIYGEAPFLLPGEYIAPNEAYFDHADWVLRRACELGFLVLLAPSYVGNGGGPEGWYQEMIGSGPERLWSYGRFLGERYRGLDNIMWVHGGDYNPPDKELVRAITDGIREADPDSVHTAHGSPGTAALDYWAGEEWLTINNAYTYEPVHAEALAQYRRGEKMPFFLMESAYENEHGAGAHRLRMQAYQAILSGAAGHLYGNNPIWHFDGPGIYPVAISWQEALGSPGAESMTVLGEFIASLDWWLLEPDLENALLMEGRGADDSRAVAARAQDGSFALVYLPAGRKLMLDFAQLSGPLVAARWFDPSSGQYRDVKGSPFPAGVEILSQLERNNAGDPDWILVLTSSDGHRS